MDFGESRTWNNQVEFKLNLKNPKLRGPESFWCPENVAEGLKDLVGQIVSLELLSDQVKPDKPADDKHWNYWCKVVGRHEGGRPSADTGAPIVQTLDQPPAPTEPAIPGYHPLPFPDCAGEIQGHLEKLAVELYIGTEDVEGKDYTEIIYDIRRLRDQIFHDLKSHRPAPLHYCYEHEMSRGKSRKTGAWGHPNTDGSWCIEGEGTTAASAPIEPSDPNSIGTVQIGADGARHPAGCNCQECWPVPDLSPDGFLARMEEPEQPPPLDDAVQALFDEGGPDDSF